MASSDATVGRHPIGSSPNMSSGFPVTERKYDHSAALSYGGRPTRAAFADEAALHSACLHIMIKAAETPGLRPTAYRLVAIIASMTNAKTGDCYPAVSTLADRLRLSEQAIRKAMRELENAGLVSVSYNAGRNNTNIYRLAFPDCSASEFCRDPEPDVSPSHIGGLFGETDVSGLSAEDRELLEFAAKRSWSHD